MSTSLTLSGTVTGTAPKGPIGPIALALSLQNQRGAIELGFEVDPSDAARAIALPAEGTVQSMFLLCADVEFDFTINGAGPTYTFKPGLPAASGQLPSGVFLLSKAPFVSSIEVTGTQTLKATGYLLRVVES